MDSELEHILVQAAITSDQDGKCTVMEMVRESDLMGLSIAAAFGGQGLPADLVNLRLAEVAAANPSLAIQLFQHHAVASRIAEFGTPTQKKKFLSSMARGETVAASAWSEKGAGANKSSLSTIARPAPGGGWHITGAKTFATGVSQADIVLVLVKTSEPSPGEPDDYGAAGQTFFLVDLDTPGVRIDGEIDMVGMRGSNTAMLSFDDVFVPADRILGCPGQARKIIAGVRHSGLTLGAVSLGIAQAALQLARQAFERPSISAQRKTIVQEKLARLAVLVAAAGAIVERAGQRGAQIDKVNGPLAAKVFASETAETVCREVAQLYGGAGYVRGSAIDRLARDARAISLMGPINELALELISKEALS